MSDKPEPYKLEPHQFQHRIGGKLYCTHCGLFDLKNEFTAWAIRVGCRHKDHPSYANKRYETTKLPF